MLPNTIWFLKPVGGWEMFTFVKLRTNDIVLLPCRCCVFPYEVTTLRRSCFFFLREPKLSVRLSSQDRCNIGSFRHNQVVKFYESSAIKANRQQFRVRRVHKCSSLFFVLLCKVVVVNVVLYYYVYGKKVRLLPRRIQKGLVKTFGEFVVMII